MERIIKRQVVITRISGGIPRKVEGLLINLKGDPDVFFLSNNRTFDGSSPTGILYQFFLDSRYMNSWVLRRLPNRTMSFEYSGWDTMSIEVLPIVINGQSFEVDLFNDDETLFNLI
jgi:hypothetical protein